MFLISRQTFRHAAGAVGDRDPRRIVVWAKRPVRFSDTTPVRALLAFRPNGLYGKESFEREAKAVLAGTRLLARAEQCNRVRPRPLLAPTLTRER
jgi:hypothetical protein